MALASAPDGLALHAVEAAVLDVDVVDVVVVLQTIDEDAILALLAGDVLHVDVSHRWDEASLGGFVGFIFQVDAHHGLTALSHAHAPHIYILRHSATAGVGLQTQHTVEVGGVHLAVLDEHVAAATRNLRANHHTAMTIGHGAVAHDDVLRRNVPETSVLVASTLDGDAVVACLEAAVLDEHVLT